MKNLNAVDYAEVFGRALRQRRKELGYSQEAIAEKAGVQRNYISSLERGKYQPTISVVFGLATALNYTPSELVAEVEKLLTAET
ncbi:MULTISPECIES: helix-turn-helix transcriptional regulator [unclassified Pseudomonas]|uniref:helix-turn-helix domain-containing protein n=1 Tax=unclassified Pseudomonas TaxID=196821 RepID=UPI00244CE160|nr:MULTISPECIES: helix-turn-helix transcriptional regulator [unclassified Pseudomonas]MDH0892898.1 helix-turn-helix domain-containing protein [Pseudomonas sp. GD03875]MDH1064628.1 helix-turn-helix domain-containing protein [Pseudomonas sp. GD03985]